jgi:Glyoxalase/Bleomycin resistance protein/Dioxygenase superfamily
MTVTDPRLFQQPWPDGEYRFFQLGFIVDDLLDTAARWASVFGVGPFHVLPRIEVACTYRGTDSAVAVQVAVAQAGPVQIELIKQHCDRPSVYRDLFPAGESGFHQLCTVTTDYDAKQAYYESLGYELASEIVSEGSRVGYFDTYADFGFFTEVVEETPEFLTQLTRIAQTCAEWDGTDPVRLLTRDGYRTPQ